MKKKSITEMDAIKFALYGLYQSYETHKNETLRDDEKKILETDYMVDFMGAVDLITLLFTDGNARAAIQHIWNTMVNCHPNEDEYKDWPEFVEENREMFETWGADTSHGNTPKNDFYNMGGEMYGNPLKSKDTGFHGWKGGRKV